jgi:Arc/MetJ-type ribon-helix-helix transcriptional regulator
VALKIFSIRLDADLVARVDATGVKRSEFVRCAIEAALQARSDLGAYVAAAGPARNELLDDLPMKPAPEPILPRGPGAGGLKPVKREVDAPAAPKKNSIAAPDDKRAAARAWGATLRETDMKSILEVARSGRYSSRDIECQLGFLGLRYKKAEDALLRSGLIRFEGGLVHAN